MFIYRLQPGNRAIHMYEVQTANLDRETLHDATVHTIELDAPFTHSSIHNVEYRVSQTVCDTIDEIINNTFQLESLE
jgi:hypothetical protein